MQISELVSCYSEIVLLAPSEYYTYEHATILGHNMTQFLRCYLGDQATRHTFNGGASTRF